MTFSPSSPKRTWFDSVFRIKPTTYQLLSLHDAQTSRSECRRLLMGLGAHVMLTQAESLGVLKCRLDKVQDPAGAMTPMKAVKFCVEVRSLRGQQRGLW
jgi:serine/threonine-protein kinase HSL1 (negative regulator of Swe1 kinase)